jgi:hypothetical protein
MGLGTYMRLCEPFANPAAELGVKMLLYENPSPRQRGS